MCHVLSFFCPNSLIFKYTCKFFLQKVICIMFLELYKMVCGENDTSINVTIPVVMIPQSAGKMLKNFLHHGASGKLFLYCRSFCCQV